MTQLAIVDVDAWVRPRARPPALRWTTVKGLPDRTPDLFKAAMCVSADGAQAVIVEELAGIMCLQTEQVLQVCVLDVASLAKVYACKLTLKRKDLELPGDVECTPWVSLSPA